MTARELVIVSFAGPGSTTELPAALGEVRVVAAHEHASATALAQAANVARADVLWMPPWTVLAPELVASIVAWRTAAASAGTPRVARVRLELRCAGTTITLAAPRLVLSSPAAIELDGDLPRPRAGAHIDDLAPPWPVALPGDLRAHLEAVNVQTSTAARLRHAAGRVATWRALLLTPAIETLRGLAAVRGSRREALPRLVIESYREVLVTAKLWEHAHPDTPA